MSIGPTVTTIGTTLLQLIQTYGPIILQLLISAGVIKLPTGVSLTLPTVPVSQLAETDKAKLSAIVPEIDHPALAAASSAMDEYRSAA